MTKLKPNTYFSNCDVTCIVFLAFIIRTMAASISCFRSSSTLERVSFLSGSDSPLAATVWIFTLQYNIVGRKIINYLDQLPNKPVKF